MKPALKIEGVSKQYRLGRVGAANLRDDLHRLWAGIRRSPNPFLIRGELNDRTKKSEEAYVWALKDINFSVNPGEVLGIIGKNGAGKSTLLKILSRITAPSTGKIEVNGRMASLLEVGTGFHPELTGGENIYLNGAILGMRRAEIKRKFDEIVDFSGVERYIDTPVKRYSSGMYVRLAFAVAAHLEPEILVIDEVLAVGDFEFQKKCLGKLEEVSGKAGRTVLFVSHNMTAVQTLCNRAVLLDRGKIDAVGNPNDIISGYSKLHVNQCLEREYNPPLHLEGIIINSIRIGQEQSQINREPLFENQGTNLSVDCVVDVAVPRLDLTFHLQNGLGETILVFSTGRKEQGLPMGKFRIEFPFPPYFFMPGDFSLTLMVVINRRESIFTQPQILTFSVLEAERNWGEFMGKDPGYLRPPIEVNYNEN
jgi:lipopolysaccharide transport system ATP-binding protein